MLRLFRFYWPTLSRTLPILGEATNRYVAALGVGSAVMAFFSPEIAPLFTGDWPGVSRGWAIVPLLMLFAYGFLKALYERFAGVEERLATIEDRRAIKNLLGDCTDRGRGLRTKSLRRTIQDDRRGVEVVTHYPEVGEWKRRTHDLIEAAFDKGEAQRFLYGVDSRPAYSDPIRRVVAHDPYMHEVEPCLARLYELIVRANSLDVNPDFDPEEWSSR